MAYLADNGGDTLDERQLERRELVIWDEPDGWVGLRGYVPPDVGASLSASMERFGKPHPVCEPEGDELPIRDTRSTGQRYADGFGQVLRLALGAATKTEPDRPHVMIHLNPDSPIADCDHTGRLSRAWFGRMLCDATLETVTQSSNGDLNLGRKARTASGRLRRALNRQRPHLCHSRLHSPGGLG